MKIAYRTRFLPLLLGAIATFFSFAYLGACSIPYQDMTLELYEKYLFEVERAKLQLLISFLFFVIGVFYFFRIRKRHRKSK